jgi:hypothetical protein
MIKKVKEDEKGRSFEEFGYLVGNWEWLRTLPVKHVVFLVREREPDCSSSVPKSNKSEEQKLLNVCELNCRFKLEKGDC